MVSVANEPQRRQLPVFNRVVLGGPGQLTISQGDEHALSISASPDALEHIVARVRGDRLEIGYKAPRVVSLCSWSSPIDYRLEVNDLHELCVRGSASVVSHDLDTDRLRLKLTGSGQMVLEHLTADDLTVDIDGSGNVLVAGDVERHNVVIRSSGAYVAETLVSDFCHVTIKGSGRAQVQVSDQLDILIAGSGRVLYSGHPNVDQQIYGSGMVNRMPSTGTRLSGAEL